MPTELDELLEKVDVEASKGAKTRPTALVLALTEIIPFHPQTIKVALRSRAVTVHGLCSVEGGV